MKINVKFTEQDLIRAHFVTYFRKPYTIFLFSILGFLFFASLLIGIIADPELAVQSFTYLIPATLLIGLQQLVAKTKYKNDHRYRQPVAYRFESEALFISGNDFDIQMNWSSIRKIIETKNWILIRQKRKITAAIPKAAFWDSELAVLKQILTDQKVKNNLKHRELQKEEQALS